MEKMLHLFNFSSVSLIVTDPRKVRKFGSFSCSFDRMSTSHHVSSDPPNTEFEEYYCIYLIEANFRVIDP